MLRKTALIILLSLIFTSFSLSQTPAEPPPQENIPEAKNSRKVDEFGRLGECDRSGRMDNFLIELMNEPQSQGYIIFYRGKGELPGQYENQGQYLYINYMRFRKFDESRVTLIESSREKQFTELWIVPPGGEIPEPTDTVEFPRIPDGEKYLYDRKNLEYYYEWDNEKFLLQSVIDEQAREQEEYLKEQEETVEGAEAAEGDAENVSESEPETAESPEEAEPVPEVEPRKEAAEQEEEDIYWFDKSFSERIKNTKDGLGVLIVYLDEELFDENKVRAHIDKAIQMSAKETNISADKFVVIFGGYRSGLIVEMWVVPKNAGIPELKPDERLPDEPDIDNN